MSHEEANRAFRVLICDPVGLSLDGNGKQDHSEVRRHIEAGGGVFHQGDVAQAGTLEPGRVHFFYQPGLSTEAQILPLTDAGQYDAVIAAATFIPERSTFPLGGVRIGAGTGNMGSHSWGGAEGKGGAAPLMNTPGCNSRATAHMVLKAILKVSPDLPVDELHRRVVAGAFDTGRDLRDFPTRKIEGRKIAILGYGNIGREVAALAAAFRMEVAVFARPRHKDWIEAEGYTYASTPQEAAAGADFLTPHLGLGPRDATTDRFANQGLIDADMLNAMNDGAVLVNYDRGELVDAAALDAALASGRIRHASIDADIFRDDAEGTLSGPLVAYLPLAERHGDRVELLPHAAADTDHPSRVAGAKQAVDQMFDAILRRHVRNLVGDLPDGYERGPDTVPLGIGRVTPEIVETVVADGEALTALLASAEATAAFWRRLAQTDDPEARIRAIRHDGAEALKAAARQRSLLRRWGLDVPFAT